MNLRLRLIVAFFLLSVVPLGAVTFYTYASNASAMRDAAGREAELLAGELTERMRLVTAQLSQQFENLMEIPASARLQPTAVSAASAANAAEPSGEASTEQPAVKPSGPGKTTAAKVPQATAAADAAKAKAAEAARVAGQLGEVAMLLNNIEVRNFRGRGGFGGPPRGFPTGPPDAGQRGNPATGRTPPGPAGSVAGGARPTLVPGTGGSPASTSGAFPGAPTPATTNPVVTSRGGASGESTPGVAPPPGSPEGRGDRRGRRDGFPGGSGQPGEGGGRRFGGPPPEEPPTDPSRIQIDLGPMRREILQQIIPDRERFDQLSDEEKAQIFAKVNERMLGIQQGIQMLQQKATEQAAEAKAAASIAAEAKKGKSQSTKSSSPATTQTPAASATTGKPVAPAAPAPPPARATPAVTPAVVAAGAASDPAPMRRKTALSGSRMNVSVEQNGQVVGQVNAEINLPNLLSTVFTTTRRDRGEVPFAVDKSGRVYTPTEADRAQIAALNTTASSPNTAPGTAVLPNWVVVTAADPTGSELKFGIARPIGDALDDLRRSSARNAGLGLGLIGLALIGIVPLSSRLTRNLSRLSEGVNQIAKGDYRARVDVKSKDEIGTLAAAFNRMAADVERHQRAAVEQERLRRELELGRQIQHDMLPQSPLRLGLTEIRGVSVPATEVGGDFFNYFQTSSGKIALLVGDVSGKGVGAALLMANIQASLRTRLAMGQDLASLARELDSDISASTPGAVYATLFVGLLDPESRTLDFVNAGHNPQYLLRGGGGLERMESTGMPIGLLVGHGYTERHMALAAGDVLFFYTDGCVEADNATGEMFGNSRLEQLLASNQAESPDDLLVRIEREIVTFRSGREPFDDATMMVVNVG
jgi:serine phosphatase RsbU (regulator of sigma subunit)